MMYGEIITLGYFFPEKLYFVILYFHINVIGIRKIIVVYEEIFYFVIYIIFVILEIH